MTPEAFRYSITVKGDPNTLDYIASHLNLNQPGRVVRHSDPNDVQITDEQRQLMQGGMKIQFGTTRLEISFNSNIDEIKSFIRGQFPNLTVD